jgi:hypothetical protein
MLLASSTIPMDRQIHGLQFIIDIKPVIQNLIHVPMFAVLSILFLQISKIYQLERRKRYAVVILCSIGFGIINEVIQMVIPGRYGGLADIGLNLIGALAGICIYILADKSIGGSSLLLTLIRRGQRFGVRGSGFKAKGERQKDNGKRSVSWDEAGKRES